MIVTLLTDFGTSDHFVAAMKGVILGLAPDATLVDVTHEIAPQDITAAAFTLAAAYDSFPPGTIHLAVVDPGVGSARRPIAVAGRHLFVGPDNGIFTRIYGLEPRSRVFRLDDETLFRHPVSATFHGRDVFAPVVGRLAAGADVQTFGEEVLDPVRLADPGVARHPDGSLSATILHVDRFGNCITAFRPEHVPAGALLPGFRLRLGDGRAVALRHHYAEAEGSSGEPFAIWGSAGFLEVAVRGDSAAARLRVSAGSEVRLYPPQAASQGAVFATPPAHES